LVTSGSVSPKRWLTFAEIVNIWDKFNTQPTDKNVWNNLNQNKTTTPKSTYKPTQSTYSKPTNDSVWDKLVTKISNIWDKISEWFN